MNSRKIITNERNYRASRPRRRKFSGNQFANVPSTEEEEVQSDAGPSASAKKLKATEADIITNLSFCYCIIEFVSVFSAIADIAICRKCKQKFAFGQSGERGVGFIIKYQQNASAKLFSLTRDHLFTMVMK